MADHPELFKQVGFQVKSLFTTKEFARVTVEYSDEVLSKCEEKNSLPKYRREDLSLQLAGYRELRGQLATFHVVAPRLAVLFETMDRLLHDEPLGRSIEIGTEPLPTSPTCWTRTVGNSRP